MPAKVVKPKSTVAVKRSRTGCQTCRSRKLKCDEAKPICGQCAKSQRECVRSQGITFRHHQNAAFDKDGQDHSLGSFFKYSQSYGPQELGSFLPVPNQLTWVYVSDPTADDPSELSPPPQTPPSTDAYQQVAAHTLEALSTAAADHISYPPQATAYYTASGPQAETLPEYGFVKNDTGKGLGGPSNNINFLLNPSHGQTSSLLIDPNLEATVAQAFEQAAEMKPASNGEAQRPENKDDHGDHEHEDGLGDSDSRVAMALRNFNETPA